MTSFRTTLTIPPSPTKITYNSSQLFVGSCFANNIGHQMEEAKFKASVNPFGIIFNPLSIGEALEMAIDNQSPAPDTYFQQGDLHKNYKLHSVFTASSREELQLIIEGAINTTHNFLKEADWLILTFGSSIVYRLSDSNNLVANCHKQPASLFTRHLLQPDEIEKACSSLINRLVQFNPSLKIILSVSPIRHIKDTLPQNSVSKSILRLVCDTLEKAHAHVHYFPAYELLLDDLRDYRFYEADMLHPNETARSYVWDAFRGSYFDDSTTNLYHRWVKIKKSLDHRPFQKHSEAYLTFKNNTLQSLEKLASVMDVQKEISQLQKG